MLGAMIACVGFTAQAQVVNYVDTFDGPVLDSGWEVLDAAQTNNHVGFTGTGQYEIEEAGFLRRDPGGTGDFTADLTIQLDDISLQNVDYKLRFLAPGFIEIVANPLSENIRVFAGEVGVNIGNVTGINFVDGMTLNLRLNYEESTGAVKVGYSLGSDPLTLLASVSGLTGFQPTAVDIAIAKISGPVLTPRVFIDRFEIQDQVLPITFSTFADAFDGPTLDPAWVTVQSAPSDHVGFVGGGLYEIQKSTTAGEAGLKYDFGGQADFVSTVAFKMQDFIGADAQVEFRHLSTNGDITVILDSVGDVRVVSEELGTTVIDLAGFSYQDGEMLEFSVSTTAVGDLTEVGVRRDGGGWIRLASLPGLTNVKPTGNEIVLIKTGAGNGNSPRLQLDHYYTDEGFAPVPLMPFTESYTGPALDASWFTTDTGTGSLVGFNQKGQYQVSPVSGATASLSRFVDFAGNATITLTARLAEFMGTGAELRFALTGGDALTAVLGSDDTLKFLTDEFGPLPPVSGLGLSDGDLVTLQWTIETEFGDWEFGMGINGDPGFVANDFGYANLHPTQTEITLAQGGGGGTPVVLLDQFSVNQGFALIPQPAEAYADDFNQEPLQWTTEGQTHLGYTNGQYYAILVSALVPQDPPNINRFLAPGGFEGVPVGSFSARLDVRFDELVGTGGSNAQTDFKYKIEGGNLMEIVFNSFRSVRFFTQNNGQNWFEDQLSDFNDGDTVNFAIAYDAAGPSVTMSVGLNGTNVFTKTRSNLVGVAPELIKINGFRFGTSNPTLQPTFLLDQLDITPGLAGVPPGALTMDPAYNGLVKLTWDLGALQSAPDVEGVWSHVMWATSPYLFEQTETQEFFRAEN